MDEIYRTKSFHKISCRFLFFIILVFLSFSAFAEINFSDLDLSGDNTLLFRVSSSGKGSFAQDAIFLTRLPAAASGTVSAQGSGLQQLSAFPEKMA